MAYYALVASLPNLEIGDEPPFSVEEYTENCAQWVTPREARILRKVLLDAAESNACPLCQAWNDREIQLRNAVVRQRGQALGIDYKGMLKSHDGYSGILEKQVADAFTRTDPLELEEEIDRTRWQLAEDLIGQNPFGFEKLLAYGIQLRIVERWNRMDVHTGKQKLEAVITANTEKEEAANDTETAS